MVERVGRAPSHTRDATELIVWRKWGSMGARLGEWHEKKGLSKLVNLTVTRLSFLHRVLKMRRTNQKSMTGQGACYVNVKLI